MTAKSDYTGKSFKGLTVLQLLYSKKEGSGSVINVYKCQLPCGHVQKVNQRSLRREFVPRCEDCKLEREESWAS